MTAGMIPDKEVLKLYVKYILIKVSGCRLENL